MKLTQKLLSLLHRVFDPDPEKFLALRVRYGGTMTWTVAEGVLTTSVVGGIGQGFAIDLTTVTITQLVAYIAARPGYQVLYVDSSGNQSLSARVLMDGTGNIAQSNGDHLYGYTSLVWAYFEAVGTELKAAKAQIPEAIKQMSVPTASSDWIDELGAYYGVPRLQGETDQSYGARIIAETVRPRANNVAMERAISYYTGQATKVTDVTIYGAGFPKYNGTITRNSAYQYQPLSTPKYGLFDVEIGYDLLGGTDQSAFADVVAGIVEKLRSAGTHMRALSMQSGAIYDTFTPPTDNSPMTIVATPVLTETLTAPTEGTFTFAGALTTMSDSFTPGTEPQAFDAIKYNYTYNSLRTRNGAIKYGGGTLETNPVVSRDWNFMTGVLPAGVAFSRNSEATYFDRNGLLRTADVNEPRFAYDPATNTLRGLLFEETRTNIAIYSNDLTDASWTKSSATVTVDTVLAPDGTPTTKLVESATSALHQISQAGRVLTGSTTYIRSVYAKGDGSGRMLFLDTDSYGNWVNTGGVKYNLDNGTIDSAGSGLEAYGMEACPNGWYRCWLASTSIASPAAVSFDIHLAVSAGTVYLGDGTSGIYLWGAQFEAGPGPSSLIPTLATAVTRASETAEVADMSWYNPNAGTLLMDCTERAPSKFITFNMSIGTDAPNYIGLGYCSTSGAATRAYMRSAAQGPLLGTTAIQASLRSVASWDSDNFSLSNDGGATTTAAAPTAGVPPAVSMRMGYSHYSTTPAPMVLRRITYWGTRFPDNILPTLSTPTA
jgi:hypothetical protein